MNRLNPGRLPGRSGNYGHTKCGGTQQTGWLDAFADYHSQRRLTVHDSQNIRALAYQFDMDVTDADRSFEDSPHTRTICFSVAAQRYQGIGYFHIGIAPNNAQIFRLSDLFDVFATEMGSPTNHNVAMINPKMP